MHSHYHAFTEQLAAALTADPRVLGLIALGSMAERRGRRPDRFSDHDFFIAEDAEALRGTTEWLPWPEQIALWFRETPHGCRPYTTTGISWSTRCLRPTSCSSRG